MHIDSERLTLLSYKFNRDVSETDIFNWLCNFDKEDWSLALTVLDGVQYFSQDRCTEILREGLYSIADGTVPTWIIPVGEIGKSGMMIAYYLNKLFDKKHNVRKIHILQSIDDINTIEQKANIVFTDDFMGTGKSVMDFYTNMKDRIPQGCKLHALTVAYMQSAENRLNASHINMHGICHTRAFCKRGSVFGSREKMMQIKEFCIKYGERLCRIRPNYKIDGERKGYIGPLGFMNGQALVCFEHTTPNNTLPILWWTGKGEKKWEPLFPRMIDRRISRKDTFEHNKYYWLSIVSKLKAKYHIFIGFDYSIQSIRLMALIYMKIRRKSDLYICRALDITMEELAALLANAAMKGIIDDRGNLTTDSINMYCELRKNDPFSKNEYQDIEIEDDDEIRYIPKRFGGIE